MAAKWKVFEVTVEGYGSAHYAAPTRSKAIYQAYLSDAFSHLKFGDFQKIARARVSTPQDDGYSYIRRAYGCDPKLGQRARLTAHEGREMAGKEGTVIYPGCTSAHVRLVLDDLDYPVSVHPIGVELLPLGAV